MKEKKYNKECVDGVMKSLGLDLRNVEECMGLIEELKSRMLKTLCQEECVNGMLMVCSLKEMVTALVLLVGLEDAKSVTVAVGMKTETESLSQFVWIMRKENELVLRDLKVMASKSVKIVMNVTRRTHASVLNAAAKIQGAVMSALVAGTPCILGIMTPA